jgi:drug/metabolite transporter (DMT)-like permease
MIKNWSPLKKNRLIALFVTFLWSTSWVLIKWGLAGIPPLKFVAIRYSIACVCLLPLILPENQRKIITSLSKKQWLLLFLYGIVFFGITQGAQFVALKYIPAVSASLILSFTVITVTLLGIPFLKETPSRVQWLGISLFVIAILLYFFPITFSGDQWIGIAVIVIGMFANSAGTLLGRHINRTGNIPAVTVTIISMAIGAMVLNIAAVLEGPFPHLNFSQWAVIVWLAVVNSALAFVLWNHSQRILPASESSLINNTMLFQIAILAWIFLGESLGLKELISLLIAITAIWLVQKQK